MHALDFARELIRFDSTSRNSNRAISDYIQTQLSSLGFEVERLSYRDRHDVEKVNVLGRLGRGTGGLAYFGHTDVVPADSWTFPLAKAFDPHVTEDRLYGRGSTDMKGSVACMLAAATQLSGRTLRHPLYLSCTADEEVDHRGADEVVRRSALYRELIAGGACGIVGEPTRLQVVYAHKGGCRMTFTSHGRAAHSSTRDGLNANLAMIPFLAEMKALHDETELDSSWHNEEFDPPTIRWNIGINDHTPATNITPPQSICTVAFRPMPGTDTHALIARAREQATALGLETRLDVEHPPFRTDPDSTFVSTAVEIAAAGPPHTVSYGTEASNLSEISQLIVLGPGEIAQAHTDDEFIELEQLARGTEIYRRMIERYCL